MRILVIQRPTMDCIDGMRLDRFTPGHQYEVGASVAALFLAERWAEPLTGAAPALAVAVGEFDADGAVAQTEPPTLVRDRYHASVDLPAALAADRRRRSRSTRST